MSGPVGGRMSGPAGRRRLLALLPVLAAAAPLAACGFAPLYAQGPDSPTGDLPEIYVANIPEGRAGQQLRQALQLRLRSPVSGADSRYVLSASLLTSGSGIAIQPDNSSTFTRLLGNASWTLATTGIAPKILATGSARTLDGYDNLDFQFFQSTISGETANTRIAANLADAIAIQVAAWFKRQHEAGLP